MKLYRSTIAEVIKDEWRTPPDVLDYVRLALGGSITLDPCSNLGAQQNVQAYQYWTREHDCLNQDWSPFHGGSLFCNPPYGRGILDPITERLAVEAPLFERGAIVLTNNSADTAWHRNLMRSADWIVDTKRLKFVRPDNVQATGGMQVGQRFFIWGPESVLNLLNWGLLNLGILRSWSAPLGTM